ncbi:MAG: DNA-processing protein DprA [Candidatus Falkowbacteria bacterium]
MSPYEIKKIKINDPKYPPLLKNISNPPQTLYYIGDFPPRNLYPLAVVGSRQADNYSQAAILNILDSDILEKVVIVSGLAEGVDTMAHKIARHTIAVLGTGLDEASFYPKKNLSIFKKIINSGGLIISEYPLGTKAKASHFPERNRIIAGLSRAVLVVQAKRRSGSLITARLALENGRDVLAVPGSIFNELSQGCHFLIAQGATPITSSPEIKDILDLNQWLTCYE